MHEPEANDPDRRTVLRTAGGVAAITAGATVLAACGGGGSRAATLPHEGGPSASSGADGTAGGGIRESSVPVGGGTVLADRQVVVTQPTAGTFKAFSAVCTHQGCLVNAVVSGMILCPCHGSAFDMSTGAPTSGPAQQPLDGRTVTVSGGTLIVS